MRPAFISNVGPKQTAAAHCFAWILTVTHAEILHWRFVQGSAREEGWVAFDGCTPVNWVGTFKHGAYTSSFINVLHAPYLSIYVFRGKRTNTKYLSGYICGIKARPTLAPRNFYIAGFLSCFCADKRYPSPDYCMLEANSSFLKKILCCFSEWMNDRVHEPCWSRWERGSFYLKTILKHCRLTFLRPSLC